MRGKVAKRLRNIVYGRDYSPRDRNYATAKNGARIDVGLRRKYQNLKKDYNG
jgi:hypothetical protein